MKPISYPTTAVPPQVLNPSLEASLVDVEQKLAQLGDALRSRDVVAIDCNASELHQALSNAIDHFSNAARSGPLPPALRQRLVQAGGQVAAQRESLARATAALDRAIDIILPGESFALYGAQGNPRLGRSGGCIRA